MTRKGLNAISRIFIIISLFAIFLPFVTVNDINIFGASMFEPLSVEAVLGLDPASMGEGITELYTAGANIYYILAVITCAGAMIASFVPSKLKNIIVAGLSLVSAVMFALVGLTFDSFYSTIYSLEASGVTLSLSIGWFVTLIGMAIAFVISGANCLLKGKIKEEKELSEVQRRNNKGWWFVSPFIIGFFCFYLQPLVISLWYVFNEFKLNSAGGGGFVISFVGFENIRYLFNDDSEFWIAITETLTQMLISVPIIIIFSIFLAVILNQKFKGRAFARAIFFMPVVVTSGIVMGIMNGDVATSFTSSGVENTDTSSLFAATGLIEILRGMNLPTSFISAFSSIVSSIFDTLWKCGVQILLFLSALQSIPSQLYEAAKIEGATGWESFWKVTFPNLVPIILVNIIYSIIDSLTDASNAVMKVIEKVAFDQFIYHRACVEAWVFFVVLLAIVGVVFGVFALIQRDRKPKKR